MTRSRRPLLMVALVAAAIAVSTAAYLWRTSATLATTRSDDGAERLFATRLDDGDGKTQALAQWRGKTLVVNFWASWCPPCRREATELSRLSDKYSANGVQFVGIALDTADNVRRFSQEHPLGYPLLIGGAAGAELSRLLGNSQLALPYTVAVGADGDVLLARLGAVSEQELDALLAAQTQDK